VFKLFKLAVLASFLDIWVSSGVQKRVKTIHNGAGGQGGVNASIACCVLTCGE
jgi:hypothetical protein